MKVAIISITKKGFELSCQIKDSLDKDSTVIKTDLFYKSVKKNMKIAFYEYDHIIAIMASGIVIRLICGLISSKLNDPSVINIDETGEYVISLLSGHIGGGNEFTYRVSNIINAKPVITTATDVNNKLAIDNIAAKFYFKIINPEEIVFFNKALLNNEKIELLFNENTNLKYLINYIQNNTLEMYLIKYNNNILKNEFIAKIDNHELTLKERTLVLGIGCRKGKSSIEVLNGLREVLNDLKLPVERINCISSGEMKKNEKGIIELSNKLNIPFKTVSIEKLKLFKSNDCSKSEFVKSNFGIDGVCEQSALIVAGYDSKLIYKKSVFDGVTIALAIN
ncbi:cobalt-precorrin 5A hydrolase [Methanobrevibacter sp. DSM 116169]|uniref:cobalt-precorrin 5A hydrolase n=1 Tax=Methanobrevibacter sp. DSM 116169 TaxID=3242727 RepID=UPI0038FC3F2C